MQDELIKLQVHAHANQVGNKHEFSNTQIQQYERLYVNIRISSLEKPLHCVKRLKCLML